MGDAGTLFEKAKGAIIRGRFRSINAHAVQNGCKVMRTGKLYENPGTPQR